MFWEKGRLACKRNPAGIFKAPRVRQWSFVPAGRSWYCNMACRQPKMVFRSSLKPFARLLLTRRPPFRAAKFTVTCLIRQFCMETGSCEDMIVPSAPVDSICRKLSLNFYRPLRPRLHSPQHTCNTHRRLAKYHGTSSSQLAPITHICAHTRWNAAEA